MKIVWEDATALVVNKPSGLLTTAAPGIDSLEVQLRSYLSDQVQTVNEQVQAVYVGLPHRIDRPVSGAVLVGKTPTATKHFCAQFQTRKIIKTYVAAVDGKLTETRGTWRDWMRKLPDEAAAEMVAEDHPDAKLAVLQYELLEVVGGMSLLKIQLETGRTHQIRLQCSHRGHPVLGDIQYRSQIEFGPAVADPRARAIALHARSIGFRHPKSARAVDIHVPFTENWQRLPFAPELIEMSPCG